MKLVKRINREYIMFSIIYLRGCRGPCLSCRKSGRCEFDPLKNWALRCVEILTINKEFHLQCLKNRKNLRSYWWALVARFCEWFVFLSFCFQNRIPKYMGHIEINTQFKLLFYFLIVKYYTCYTMGVCAFFKIHAVSCEICAMCA